MKNSTVVAAAAAHERSDSLELPLSKDTMFVCALAMILAFVGIKLAKLATRLLSQSHPARHTFGSVIESWEARVKPLPWGSFVPTAGPISPTQIVWLFAAAILVNVALHAAHLPHVPLPGHPVRRALGY